MVKHWLKILIVLFVVILLLTGIYDIAKISKAYYDTDHEANNIAEQLALTFMKTKSESVATNQAQILANENGLVIVRTQINQNDVEVTVSRLLTDTLITSRIQRLSNYNLIETQGSAPLIQ